MSDPLLDDLRLQFVQSGAGPALVAAVEKAVQSRREIQGSHAGWARLCEDTGLFPLAFREYQLALRDDPNDAALLLRLANLYRERGRTDLAVELLERLLQANGPPPCTSANWAS